MARFRRLLPGDPLPRIVLPGPTNPQFVVDTLAGRYLVLCFAGTLAGPGSAAAQAAIAARPDLFDDRFAAAILITTERAESLGRAAADARRGPRILWDGDAAAARACGAAATEPGAVRVPFRPLWIIADPTLRLVAVIPFEEAGPDHAGLIARLAALPPPDRFAGRPVQAPILYLPRVFDPDLCARLVATYEAQGGELSGFMRQVGGRTVGAHDTRHKVRRDVILSDPALIAETRRAIERSVVPEIRKVHQFAATRMERYLVACYDAAEGGHFAPHRDNTTLGTAHRRFAVSVGLSEDYEGGEVSFPEYGPQGFKAPLGGAVVFSCSLLHAVSRVTAGRRYAFLPFLYDEAAATIRDRNAGSLEPAAGERRDGPEPE